MKKGSKKNLRRDRPQKSKWKKEDDALQHIDNDEPDTHNPICSYAAKACPLDLSISRVETTKDDIQQPYLAKHPCMYIPPLGSSVIISGKSGSGKSTLLANLMTSHRFYGACSQKPKGWFDKIFLFSPTANGDDVQKSLKIPKEHVFTDLSEANDLIELILDSQQKKLDDASGADKVEQFAIIFDDVIGDTKFMNDKAFTRCFYQIRHVNATCFICTQHFKRIPRVCRLQASFVFFFQGSSAEVEVVVDEYAPPMYSKKEFRQIVADTTREPFSFLTINMKKPWDLRFRRNLNEFIHLPRISATGTSDGVGRTNNIPTKLEYKQEEVEEEEEEEDEEEEGEEEEGVDEGDEEGGDQPRDPRDTGDRRDRRDRRERKGRRRRRGSDRDYADSLPDLEPNPNNYAVNDKEIEQSFRTSVDDQTRRVKLKLLSDDVRVGQHEQAGPFGS